MTKLLGNAVVGQSGGPTSAINATLAGVIAGVLDAQKNGGCIKTLYGMRNGIEGLLKEELVDLTERFAGGKELSCLIHTPAAALGSCRKKLPPVGEDDAVYEKLLQIFRTYDIRYFFYIGGNDSMDAVAKLSEYTARVGYEMRIVGVPKTIDNDLVVTDHTPGFGSAAKYIATTLTEILCDCAVYRVPAVTLVEIMGRDAGWLAASAALAGREGEGVDYIYLPERAFDMDSFLADVEKALGRHPNVVIAVSEGLRDARGRYVGEGTQSGVADAFGHKYLAGTAKALELVVKARFGCKVRSIELNLPQRCASHLASKTDLEESLTVGASAVEHACLRGASRVMMVLERREQEEYAYAVNCYDISVIANRVKKVPDEFINAEGNGVTEACVHYLAPLIAGESFPEYENGIPKYLSL